MNSLPRRQFLRTAALAAAASALPRRLLAAPGIPAVAHPPKFRPGGATKRTLRKAIGLGMVDDGKKMTVAEKLALVRDVGFDGVEIDRPGEPRNDPGIDELLAAQEKSGVRIHGVVDSVHWQQPLNHPDPAVRKRGIEGLQQALRDAQKLGSLSVLLVPVIVSEDLAYDEAWTRSQAAIREVLPLAAELRVKIAIENVWNGFLLSPLEAARYVDELASPWAAFHFDIGNVVNFGFADQWIRILGKRIVKLHIKDYSRKRRDAEGLWKGFDVELGEGDADYARVMKALDEVGYSTAPEGNWATAEVRGGDRKRLQQVREQMDRLFAL